MKEGLGLDYSNSGQGHVSRCCENGNEFFDSKIFGEFLHYLIIVSRGGLYCMELR